MYHMINVHHRKQHLVELMNILTGVEMNVLKANAAVSKPMDIIALLTKEAILVRLFVS